MTTDDGERLVRIETKLDALIGVTDKRGDDHEKRLRQLEQRVWLILVGAAASGGGAGFLVQAIIGV